MVQLYHSSPSPLPSDVLEPRTAHREINGVKQPLVFASDSMMESLTYTVPKGVRDMNVVVPDTGAQILFLSPESEIGEPELQGGIYSFESDNFAQAILDGEPSTQWVSSEAVSLADATYTRISSINDIMAGGVQILQLGGRDDFGHEEFEAVKKLRDPEFFHKVEELVQGGQLRWLNQERGINPQNPFPVRSGGRDATLSPVIQPAPTAL